MTTTITTTTVHTRIDTALGDLTLVRRGEALTGVYFPHHWTRPDPATFGERVDDGFDEVTRQLTGYLEGQRSSFDLTTEVDGTDGQLQVWALLEQIPYGETVTYGQIASRTGTDARDVGAAVGANPLSIVVPCHRVLGKDGRLTGYAGGLKRKQHLLDLESAASRLF